MMISEKSILWRRNLRSASMQSCIDQDTGTDVSEINVDFKVAFGDSFLVGLLLSSKGCSFLVKLENEKPLHAQGMRSGARRCG
jgi:hypothetical protein